MTQLGQRSKRQVEIPLFYLLPHSVPLSSNEASRGRRTQDVDRSSGANRVDSEEVKPSPVPAGRGERAPGQVRQLQLSPWTIPNRHTNIMLIIANASAEFQQDILSGVYLCLHAYG